MYVDMCGGSDIDTQWFMYNFLMRPPLDVIEIGCDDEPIAPLLQSRGFNVTGFDLRKRYDKNATFKFRREDFVTAEIKEKFDVAVSISTIEHFGIAYFKDGGVHDKEYDSLACQKVYNILRPGGLFFMTVPYGKDPTDEGDWRIYTASTLRDRIVGKFQVAHLDYFFSAASPPYIIGNCITKDVADTLSVGPNLTVGAILLRC